MLSPLCFQLAVCKRILLDRRQFPEKGRGFFKYLTKIKTKITTLQVTIKHHNICDKPLRLVTSQLLSRQYRGFCGDFWILFLCNQNSHLTWQLTEQETWSRKPQSDTWNLVQKPYPLRICICCHFVRISARIYKSNISINKSKASSNSNYWHS